MQTGVVAPNTRLERTRHNGTFIRSCVGAPLKRNVRRLLCGATNSLGRFAFVVCCNVCGTNQISFGRTVRAHGKNTERLVASVAR